MATSVFHSWRADPAAVPPLIMNSDPGSFARRTFEVRIPAILREALSLNPSFDEDVRRNIETLHAELTAGAIRGLIEEAPDRPFWDTAAAPYVGRSWLDVPWYWAEAFFYRRVLEATRYFQPGPWQGIDPYAAKKRAEWSPDAAPRAVAQLL